MSDGDTVAPGGAWLEGGGSGAPPHAYEATTTGASTILTMHVATMTARARAPKPRRSERLQRFDAPVLIDAVRSTESFPHRYDERSHTGEHLVERRAERPRIGAPIAPRRVNLRGRCGGYGS